MIRPLSALPQAPLLFLIVAFFAAPGCGGSAENSNTGDGDSNGDGDGDGVCDGFENDSVRHLEIEIRNERSDAIYIGPRESTCGTRPPFEVENASGSLLETNLNSCMPLCEDYMSGQNLGCPPVCLYPEVITISPGDSHLAVWDTRHGVPLELPAECNAADDVDMQCSAARAIDPGTFTFLAHAGTTLSCDTPCDDCGPNGAACPGQLVVQGEELSAESTVDLDASYGIVPVPRGEGAPVPGATNGVVLVFRE
jgi:hypothetical protein